jgi:hypothetical protein
MWLASRVVAMPIILMMSVCVENATIDWYDAQVFINGME